MTVTVKRKTEQYRGAFTDMWFVKDTACNFANAATGSGTSATLTYTVPGVAVGDIVMGIAVGVDQVGAAISGYVNAANSVTLVLLNNTAGAVDLASTTCRFVVGHPSW